MKIHRRCFVDGRPTVLTVCGLKLGTRDERATGDLSRVTCRSCLGRAQSAKSAPRKPYELGVAWIALNDEPLIKNVDEIAEMISVMLLAEIFGKDSLTVALDILKARERHEATP